MADEEIRLKGHDIPELIKCNLYTRSSCQKKGKIIDIAG